MALSPTQEFITTNIGIIAGTTIVIVLFILLGRCAAMPDQDQKNCIDNGGSWIISEKTEGNYPDYECVMP